MTSPNKHPEAQPAWCKLTPEAALQRLTSSAKGLSEDEARRHTPLQENLDHVGKVLAAVAGAVVIAVVVLRGCPLLEMFVFGIALTRTDVSEEAADMTLTFLSLALIRFFKAYNFRSRPPLGVPQTLRQQVAEPGHSLGTCAAVPDRIATGFAAAIRNL